MELKLEYNYDSMPTPIPGRLSAHFKKCKS